MGATGLPHYLAFPHIAPGRAASWCGDRTPSVVNVTRFESGHLYQRHGATAHPRVSVVDSLSNGSRTLTWLLAVAYAVLGAVLYAAPEWAAREFPWKVSEFVAMTMGGWCLGNAIMAWLAARDWHWSTVRPLLVYLWSFSVLEVVVLVRFRDLFRAGEVMTWPYVLTLALGVVAAVVAIAEWSRRRPLVARTDDPVAPTWFRALGILFVVVVGYLAVVGILDADAGRTRNVFPEELSPFTLRAFGVFFLSIVIGTLPLVLARTLTIRSTLAYGWGGVALIVPITVAAFLYLDRFDFSDHPRQSIYIGTYVAAFVALVPLLGWGHRRLRAMARSSVPAVDV